MSVKWLLLFIICISFKSYWRLVHQHTGKKGKHFPTNPSSEFQFESRSKEAWESTCVFMSTVKFSAFFFFLSLMTWSNISRGDLCSLKYLCVHTGSLQQFKIRKHLENMRPCLADSPFSLCTGKCARMKENGWYITLICDSTGLWVLWVPRWEFCSGSPKRPHGSPDTWHIPFSFDGTHEQPLWRGERNLRST